MVARKITSIRLDDNLQEWLKRNKQGYSDQLRDDLETLQALVALAESKRGKKMTLDEAFKLVEKLRAGGIGGVIKTLTG